MGIPFSALSKLGLPGFASMTTGQVYDQHFKTKDIKDFEQFHLAYVDFCKYFNTIMPGQDFDTPSLDDMKDFFEKWKDEENTETKKEKFMAYLREQVTVAKVDDRLFIMAGLAVPAAAVVVKRSSEHIPYVKNFKLKYIPDVVFVPFCTLFAIMGATALQMSRKSKSSSPQL